MRELLHALMTISAVPCKLALISNWRIYQGAISDFPFGTPNRFSEAT